MCGCLWLVWWLILWLICRLLMVVECGLVFVCYFLLFNFMIVLKMFVIVNYCLLCELIVLFVVFNVVMGLNGSGKLSVYCVLWLFVDIV